jgi:hypothetical protein
MSKGSHHHMSLAERMKIAALLTTVNAFIFLVEYASLRDEHTRTVSARRRGTRTVTARMRGRLFASPVHVDLPLTHSADVYA